MTERRQGLQDLMVEFREFVAENRQWRLTTDEYRKSLCAKIDDINKRIYALPCEKRSTIYEAINSKINRIWAVLFLLVSSIIGLIGVIIKK